MSHFIGHVRIRATVCAAEFIFLSYLQWYFIAKARLASLEEVVKISSVDTSVIVQLRMKVTTAKSVSIVAIATKVLPPHCPVSFNDHDQSVHCIAVSSSLYNSWAFTSRCLMSFLAANLLCLPSKWPLFYKVGSALVFSSIFLQNWTTLQAICCKSFKSKRKQTWVRFIWVENVWLVYVQGK